MKNKKLAAWLKGSEGGEGGVKRAFRFLWNVVARNLGLKLLSVVLAVLLWNYVISTNSSITRFRTVTGLTGYLTGQSNMSANYGLALLSDPSEALSNISVRVEVAQADFYKVSSDNVQVTLDLNSVRTAGTQQVALRATTSYGRVVSITPDRVSLTFEAMDSRSIPVNVETVGAGESDRWYTVSRSNPQVLTIRGAASVVQNISSAQVAVDIEGQRSTFMTAQPYVLVSADGSEIPQTMLERTSNTISVTVSVYPMREIAINAEPASLLSGEPAEGYYVESVTLQPQKLTVAADQELLDGLSELHLDPISIEGATQTFSARASVSALSSFRFISAEEVYVTVNVAEEQISMWLEDVPISYINLGEGLKLARQEDSLRVMVTGPRSDVTELAQGGLLATVNLEGCGAGEYVINPDFGDLSQSQLSFTTERTGVSVKIEENVQAD